MQEAEILRGRNISVLPGLTWACMLGSLTLFGWKNKILPLVELNNFSKKKLHGFSLERGFLRVKIYVSFVWVSLYDPTIIIVSIVEIFYVIA